MKTRLFARISSKFASALSISIIVLNIFATLIIFLRQIKNFESREQKLPNWKFTDCKYNNYLLN